MRQPSAASAWQYAPGIRPNNTKLRMPAMQSEPSPTNRVPTRDASLLKTDPGQRANRSGSFSLRFSTAMTASVRLATLSTLRMAVT
jgi:hypothetical protein